MSTDRPSSPRLPHADADHYILDGHAKPMPRTTTVIDRGIGKPFLTTWAARLERESLLEEMTRTLGDHVDEETAKRVLADMRRRIPGEFACNVQRDAAAQFGSATHAILEDHLRDLVGLAPLERSADNEPPPPAEQAARRAIAWLDAISFEPHPDGIETRLWSEDDHLWSAGTADAFGTAELASLLENATWNRRLRVEEDPSARVPLLIDWKTSNSVGVSHKVQMGAYMTYLIEQKRLTEPCYACILRVARTEEDPHPLEALLIHPQEFARYGGAFRFIRRIYNFLSQEEELERAQWRRRRAAASGR